MGREHISNGDVIASSKYACAIAHRLSTTQHSDEILVSEGGRIAERGDHQALMAQGGFYANLVSDTDIVISE